MCHTAIHSWPWEKCHGNVYARGELYTAETMKVTGLNLTQETQVIMVHHMPFVVYQHDASFVQYTIYVYMTATSGEESKLHYIVCVLTGS